jgi:hypothetical protein
MSTRYHTHGATPDTFYPGQYASGFPTPKLSACLNGGAHE